MSNLSNNTPLNELRCAYCEFVSFGEDKGKLMQSHFLNQHQTDILKTKRLKDKKVTMRLPKYLLKDLQHYAIDHDTNVTKIIRSACHEFLNKQKYYRSYDSPNESKDAQPTR